MLSNIFTIIFNFSHSRPCCFFELSLSVLRMISLSSRPVVGHWTQCSGFQCRYIYIHRFIYVYNALSYIRMHGHKKRLYQDYKINTNYIMRSVTLHKLPCIYIYIYTHILRVSEQRNILHEIRKRKANCIGHILRRNFLLKEVIEGKIKERIEVTRRRRRRRKKLLNGLEDRSGYSHLKEETLDRIKWRNRLEEALDLSYDRLLILMPTLFSLNVKLILIISYMVCLFFNVHGLSHFFPRKYKLSNTLMKYWWNIKSSCSETVVG
jgi:hypothetical protein